MSLWVLFLVRRVCLRKGIRPILRSIEAYGNMLVFTRGIEFRVEGVLEAPEN